MAPPAKAVVLIAAGVTLAGLAAFRWWKGRQQTRGGCQNEAALPGSPATAPSQPPAEVPIEGVVLPSPSASSSSSFAVSPFGSLALSVLGSPRSPPPASASTPSSAASVASAVSPVVVLRAPVGSPAWLIAKAEKLASDIAAVDPDMVEHMDEVEDLQERGRQILDLLRRRYSQLAGNKAFWEALRQIRFVPVERANGIEVPPLPLTFGFEAPAQIVMGQYRELRFAGHFVGLEECDHCLRTLDEGDACPACQPCPQVCAALGMPNAQELAAAARRLCNVILLANPSEAKTYIYSEVERVAPAVAVLDEDEATQPASESVLRRDMRRLLHPRGPLDLPEESVAWLDRRIGAEAFMAKYGGSFAYRLEKASCLPRPESQAQQTEEEWRAAQQEEAKRELARLRRHFGEAFDA